MKTGVEFKKSRWLNKYKNSIDLDPFFQRGQVWNPGKKQYFIDSLVRGWGTPKLFLWQTGKDTFACLDGKQRLTSLFSFMADDLPLGSKSEKLSGKKYSKLPRDVQDAFDEYEFAVEVITEAKPEEAVELYKRLQGGTPLNFGEKIFAYPGKMTEFIKRRLVNRKLLKTTVGLANTRYSHYAVCAQLCLLTIKGAKEDLKLKNLEKFFREYAEFNERSPEARKIYIVIKFLEKAFLGEKETALRNRPNIVSVFNLVSDISTRGNILGKEREIGKFFRKFTKDLQKEFEKENISPEAART